MSPWRRRRSTFRHGDAPRDYKSAAAATPDWAVVDILDQHDNQGRAVAAVDADRRADVEARTLLPFARGGERTRGQAAAARTRLIARRPTRGRAGGHGSRVRQARPGAGQ